MPSVSPTSAGDAHIPYNTKGLISLQQATEETLQEQEILSPTYRIQGMNRATMV